MTKYLLAVLLSVVSFSTLVFSAKPMSQGFQFLEQTAEYIAAEGPAMIASAGVLFAMDERSNTSVADSYFPEPETEQVSHNSNGIETDFIGHSGIKVLGEVRNINESKGCIIS